MNQKQKEVISKLRGFYKTFNHSPTKREIPKIFWECCREFGSFNKAKKKAGLEVKNIRITNFPEKAFVPDKDLVAISSYLTFDGHLYKNGRAFFYSSKRIEDINDFNKLISKKFRMPGKCQWNSAGSENQTHKIYVFNKELTQKLIELGIPNGDKTNQSFQVPNWIKNNKEFSRMYLKVAFLCEGSMKEKRKNPRIQINLAKTQEFLSSGFMFMEDLRKMLRGFRIRTTNCAIIGERIRKKDNKISKDIRFRVITSDNNKFIKEIGWLK